ncbi:MAG: hypothetical protein H6R17_2097 [Proteobacteria bacterium]|nr:hypothetical protein [Pseudomonadota bacterium]
MLQRTRVMQRNVRMVLILVDSQSTVADLCLKTGNPQLTENALSELEKGGFIEPRGEPDSMWAESTKVAQEVRAAADSHRRVEIARAASRALTEPPASDVAISTPALVKTAEPSDLSISRSSLGAAQTGQVSSSVCPEPQTGSFSDAQSQAPRVSAPSFVERVKGFFTKQKSNITKAEAFFVESLRPLPPSDDRREEEARIPSVEIIRTSVPRVIWNADEVKPIRRGQAQSIGWPATVVLGIAGVLAVAFVTVLLFPYDSYLPELEIAISNACGRSAKVGSLHLDVYPQAGIVLGDVRIGAGQNEIRIDEIRLQPALGTLMAARKIFREVVVSGVSLPVEMIAGLPSVFSALSNSSSRFGLGHLSLERADISFSGLGFSNLGGEARLSADGQLQSLRLRSADRSLNLVATPLAQGVGLVVEGYGWRPVPGSPFLFDSVNLNAAFENGTLTIKSMALRIFDGLIEGGAVLSAGQAPSIVGEVSLKRVNASRLGDAIGLGQQFGGEIAGKMRFSTKAESWASIFSAIDGDGEFSMQRGSIGGIDLVEAARSVSRAPIQGGATRFENLSGAIKLTPERYQFSGLVLNSGLMQSTGYLNVSRELTVSGKMELKMRGTANQARVPISISGSLKSPTVQAGRGG